jgi:hypothetical protein
LHRFVTICNTCSSYSCSPASRIMSHTHTPACNPHILVARFKVSFINNAVLTHTTVRIKTCAIGRTGPVNFCTLRNASKPGVRLCRLVFAKELKNAPVTEMAAEGPLAFPVLEKFHKLDSWFLALQDLPLVFCLDLRLLLKQFCSSLTKG